MSMNMVGRATEYRVKAGSLITLQLTITTDAGVAKNLTNTVTYATGKWNSIYHKSRWTYQLYASFY